MTTITIREKINLSKNKFNSLNELLLELKKITGKQKNNKDIRDFIGVGKPTDKTDDELLTEALEDKYNL